MRGVQRREKTRIIGQGEASALLERPSSEESFAEASVRLSLFSIHH
jgi:hypothetical protein